MFQVNDTVSYGGNGICQVVDITARKSGKNMVRYYILKPLFNQGSTIFVPVENKTLVGRMRLPLSQDEVLSMIHKLPETEEIWYDTEADRQTQFKEILLSGDQAKILRVLKGLYHHQHRCLRAGRKFRISDERMMKAAQNVLQEEFAYVLGIGKEEVEPYITRLCS